MNSLYIFKTKHGKGAVDLNEISAIVPDITKPTTSSILYTTMFQEGLCVEGASHRLIGEWSELLEQNIEEEEADFARALARIDASED